MAPTLAHVRVRLIQIRERPDILAEERESFRVRCALRDDQIVVTNAIREDITPALTDGFDAVMIGGAGAYSVTQTYEWTQSLIDLCQACADRSVPLFGSCWGHQFIGRAFGGTVVTDSTRTEMGTHHVRLTAAGESDVLFSSLPLRFDAQMGHQDRVSTLPPGATELATNEVSPNQAFRIDGAAIYGTQFHSELDESTERGRLLAYRAHYPDMADQEHFDRTIAGLRQTPEVEQLLRHFLLLHAVDGGDELLRAELAAQTSP